MSQILTNQTDAAEAMIYNEYAQVLEANNPATGKLYTPADFNVIDFNKDGTAMLQDMIFAREVAVHRHQPATAEKFLGLPSRAGSTAATTPPTASSRSDAGSKLGTSTRPGR